MNQIKKWNKLKKKQKRENIIDEYIDSGRFFELSTSDKNYVNSLHLHEIQYEILLDYKGDLSWMDWRILDLLNMKQISDLEIWMISKVT